MRSSWNTCLIGRGQSRHRLWRRALSHRPGYSLVELVSALIILGVVFTLSISILTNVAYQRRAAEQRQFALQHAANLLEQFTSHPWSELPPGSQKLQPPSPDLLSMLPELDQQVEVQIVKDELDAKRVSVAVTWKNRHGQFQSPVRLSGWVFPLEKGAPL